MKTDNDVRTRLICDNMGLVYSCANKFTGRGADYEDLVQSGCIGLIKAADGFDASLGYKFSTYAVPAILGEIKRIFRDGGSVKVGRADREKASELLRIQMSLTDKLGRSPTVDEIAENAGLDRTRTAQLLCAVMPTVSLTADDDEDGSRITDIPCSDDTENIGNSVALESAMDELCERDRKIVEFRYYSGLTQSVTAEKLGMTQVQVSRREKVILSALREKLG